MPVANRCTRSNKTQVRESGPFGPLAGLYPAIIEKGPWPKFGENDQLNVEIGKN